MGKLVLNGKEYTSNREEKHNYSTSEQVVGTWIDGKPVYEVVVKKNISSSDTGNYITFSHGILNIDNIVSFEGYLLNSSGGYFSRISVNNTASGSSSINGQYSGRAFSCDRSNMNFMIGSAIYSEGYREAICIIKYTKTTD